MHTRWLHLHSQDWLSIELYIQQQTEARQIQQQVTKVKPFQFAIVPSNACYMIVNKTLYCIFEDYNSILFGSLCSFGSDFGVSTKVWTRQSLFLRHGRRVQWCVTNFIFSLENINNIIIQNTNCRWVFNLFKMRNVWYGLSGCVQVPQKCYSQSVLLQKLQNIKTRELDSENIISMAFKIHFILHKAQNSTNAWLHNWL